MRLKVFQSDKGDCLLLTGKKGERILVDGGMRKSYREHVAPALGRLRSEGKRLDLVYVSHIDQDHISGILQLLDDLLAWRVYDYQRRSGNEDFPRPDRDRPPEVDRLWHNAFHHQVNQNAGDVERMLAASASVLEPSDVKEALEEAERQRELAASVPEGIQLSRRTSAEQLDIPVNREFGGRLIQVRERGNTVKLDGLELTVIGPFEEQLEKLRDTWNDWLRDHPKQLEDIRRRMREDAARLATGQIEGFRTGLEQRAGELGDITKVTIPNLASLMLLVEEGEKTLLLTGDGHPKHIRAGLQAAGRLDGDGIHVNVLKVQHHCSENNIDADFCKEVTADHYVFCANGAHANPDLRGLHAIIDSRLGPKARRSPNPAAGRGFKLWFNSSSKATPEERNKRQMREVEDLIASEAKRSKGRLRYSFLDGHALELRV